MSNLITMKDLQDKLKVSRATIYNYINDKGLPFKKVGRLTRFDANEVNEWVEKQKK